MSDIFFSCVPQLSFLYLIPPIPFLASTYTTQWINDTIYPTEYDGGGEGDSNSGGGSGNDSVSGDGGGVGSCGGVKIREESMVAIGCVSVYICGLT